MTAPTFPARSNRFRKENGHIFQGGQKAILVEPGEVFSTPVFESKWAGTGSWDQLQSNLRQGYEVRTDPNGAKIRHVTFGSERRKRSFDVEVW